MNVLVINSGSSSLKLQVIETDPARAAAGTEIVRARGQIDALGPDAVATVRASDGPPVVERLSVSDHGAALGVLLAMLERAGLPVLAAEVGAVGHRIVHGGERFTASTVIDADVLAAIEECSPLAPLHNPPNLAGYRAALQHFPAAVPVAVFDTAFHQTIPPEAYVYALPYAYYERHRIRRYGFHGTSHRYVTERAAAMLGRPGDDASFRLVSCNLGNGCSVTAVKGGRSLDTSMGFTPVEGLVMGSRCGDLDPAALLQVMELEGLDGAGADDLLNKKSGLLGLSGRSNDMRTLLAAEEAGDARARLAIDVFCYRARKYIGAYAAALGGLGAIAFTGGIGENAAAIRARILAGLEAFGVHLDDALNRASARGERRISGPASPVPVLVVPANEELVIARDTFALAGAPPRVSP